MNQQEQATQHAAIFQDTINGTNDPTPWPVTMWASSGDTIWTAGTARTAGEDSVGRLVDRTAGEDEGRWTNRQRRQAARLLIQELTGTQDPTQARSKTTDRPTVEQYVPEGGKTPDAIGDETPAPPRKTETDMATKQRQDPIVPASQSPAAGPERRHTDLKSTLDRFRTRLKKNLDGLNADPPTAGTDRNRGQRKTL